MLLKVLWHFGPCFHLQSQFSWYIFVCFLNTHSLIYKCLCDVSYTHCTGRFENTEVRKTAVTVPLQCPWMHAHRFRVLDQAISFALSLFHRVLFIFNGLCQCHILPEAFITSPGSISSLCSSNTLYSCFCYSTNPVVLVYSWCFPLDRM